MPMSKKPGHFREKITGAAINAIDPTMNMTRHVNAKSDMILAPWLDEEGNDNGRIGINRA